MKAKLTLTTILLFGLMAPAGAHEPNGREHPDPLTAARDAQHAALAQRLRKNERLIILDAAGLGCTNGDIVVLDGTGSGARRVSGIAIVPALCR